MALHLVKLCVGVDSVEQLQGWLDRHDGQPTVHTTRMTPKRKDEILAGGSLYWVIKRVIQVRQPILDLEEFTDSEGIKRCNIWLENTLVRTAPSPRRAFQGWRYLKAEDAPSDLTEHAGGEDLPDELRRKLIELGAW
ncbi:DUF1489 family protein [Oceanicaulis sp. LC35]|uniref:DUF1489 family protein n=1 Tax=Oceanicaulis sp. LC35 TaxID=3349635 RepID=UPI003F84BD3C